MSSPGCKEMKKLLESLGDKQTAEHSQRFFKTGRGEYGEGDIFLGIRVPVLRQQAKRFNNASLPDILQLLQSEYHEIRLFALILMVNRYKRADDTEKEKIFNAYINNSNHINNWDMVDISAPHVVGEYLADRDRSVLLKLAKSGMLWERRIAIIATQHFIRLEQFDDTLVISELLLNDQEDLIHKATGWMLREVGKRNKDVEVGFLNQHYSNMPRTMLRYAIEKFSPKERQAYLKGEI